MSGIIGKNSDRSSGVIGTVAVGMASLAADSSPQLGGFLDANGNYIQMQKGGDISSASPTVIDTDGDFFAVTGTTNFSAFTVAADRHFFLEFGGALTMTHGAGTLDLPGAANITTAASDVGEFVSTAANVVTCVNYTKRDGTAVVSAGGGGKVLQVVNVGNTTAVNIGATEADTALTATITTTADDSTILVLVTQELSKSGMAVAAGHTTILNQAGTNVVTVQLQAGYNAVNGIRLDSCSFSYLSSVISSASTSVVFKTRGKHSDASYTGNMEYGHDGSRSTITLIEIGA
jgi:hypothetical protein